VLDGRRRLETLAPEPDVPMDTLIDLRQRVFEYESGLAPDAEAIKTGILATIQEQQMAPMYVHLCDRLGWAKDEAILKTMTEANATALEALEAKRKDAEENLGETEVNDVELEIVNHLHRIGDKEACVKKIDETMLKVKGMGKQLDMLLQKIRLGLAFGDRTLMKDNIAKAAEILKQEGDWERRNRLKVYEGLYAIICRDFAKAAALLLEAVATFSCTELVDFKTFIFYTVFVSLPTLSRPDLKEKVVENSEVLSVMPESPDVNDLLTSVYHCRYGRFFPALDTICERIRRNVWLAPHLNFYYRELRILAFKQFLASYRSVTLEKMAGQFAIPVDLLDAQLCCFIAATRLNCKIDRVSGRIITARYDARNTNYQALLKNGDLLLNKIHKLARIVGT
jgi:26S proteasome regulatory subunit N7